MDPGIVNVNVVTNSCRSALERLGTVMVALGRRTRIRPYPCPLAAVGDGGVDGGRGGSLLFRERAKGGEPTIVIPGFVPDATESVEFLRPLLRSRGAIYYLNYSRDGFDHDRVVRQLSALLETLRAGGQRPTLLGISFGAGLIVDMLRRGAVDRSAIGRLVLISPVLTLEDLVGRERGGRGVRMLECSIRRIVEAGSAAGGDVERQIERARRSFGTLFDGGASGRPLTCRHRAIARHIAHAIERTSARAAHERFLALKRFSFPRTEEPLFEGPVLIILSDGEGKLLVPSSPTLALMDDPVSTAGIFPQGVVRKLVDEQGGTIPHASLIFHHTLYRSVIGDWFASGHREEADGLTGGRDEIHPEGFELCHPPHPSSGGFPGIGDFPCHGARTAA